MSPKKCEKCAEICGKNKAPVEVVRKLEMMFRCFLKCDTKSLLKKYLTREIFDSIKWKKTLTGGTLLECIQSGFTNLESIIGLYAGDPLSYVVFNEIFDLIIRAYHRLGPDDIHPPLDYGEEEVINELGDIDPSGGKYVKSIRIRACRTLKGFPFNPLLTEEQYTQIENMVTGALEKLEEEFAGAYRPLSEITPDEQQKLVACHLLFKDNDPFLEPAKAYEYWPTGRGVFMNEEQNFLVWVNSEDHLKIMTIEPKGNLQEAYARFVRGMTELEKNLSFVRDDDYGFLTMCPTNIGTTLRVSALVKLKNLAKDLDKLNALADRFRFELRGSGGEGTEVIGGIYDISNKRRAGFTEIELVQKFAANIRELITIDLCSKDDQK